MPSGRLTLIAGLGVVGLVMLVLVVLLLRLTGGARAPASAAVVVPSPSQPTPTPTPVPTPTPTPARSPGQTAAAPTALPRGQTVVSFAAPQTVRCPAQGVASVHLTWSTLNAASVYISIDGPGKYADYPANGSADLPFACSQTQHTYLITTQGTGTPATRSVVVRRG